jgi:hypothetical protein
MVIQMSDDELLLQRVQASQVFGLEEDVGVVECRVEKVKVKSPGLVSE